MDYKPEQSPEQKLDIVLQKMVNLPTTETIYYTYIVSQVNAIGYEKEIFEILLKLRKDGYITSDTESGHGSYTSNFDGRLFIDNGGYQVKALKEANEALLNRLEIDRRRTLDKTLEDNSSRLNLLTLWLAIGTGALALIELAKFLVWMFPDLKPVLQEILKCFS